MPIVVNLDVELAKRKMTVAQLATEIGITPANLFVLKSGRAKAVRFTTLEAICRALRCQPGDLLVFENDLIVNSGTLDGRLSRVQEA